MYERTIPLLVLAWCALAPAQARPDPQRHGEAALQIVPAAAFSRLDEDYFGAPGVVVIESVGDQVRLAALGPFSWIHDAYFDPGAGVPEHPHKDYEHLIYVLRGQVRHEDSLSRSGDVIDDGDLARMTDGSRGIRHSEWNGREDLRTRFLMIIYKPDAQPVIEKPSYAVSRAAATPQTAEGAGVRTRHLIGGRSTFRVNQSRLIGFFDSTLAAHASLTHVMSSGSGLALYPLEGSISVGEHVLSASSRKWKEGPDAICIAWSRKQGREVRLTAGEQPARVLRLEFRQ